MNVFAVFQHLQKDKQRKQRHSLKLGKKRRESSKRNYYIISPRVIIKAIIIIFVAPEICDVPAPLAEACVVLGCVQRDTCTGLARIAPIRHRRLRLPFSCTNAAFWRDTFEAAPRWRQGRGRGRNLSRCERR